MTPLSSQTFFSMLLTSSTLMFLSSDSWLMMWAAMEINMFMFLPMMKPSALTPLESMIKYLLIQSSSSLIILLLMLTPMLTSLTTPLALLSILTKLGLAPCHAWLITVVKPLNWMTFILLSTWQKLIPLMLLMSFIAHYKPSTPILLISVTGLMWGSLAGLNQSMLRVLITYSSISHLSWTSTVVIHSPTMGLLYALTYFTISLMFMLPLTSAMKSNFWGAPATSFNKSLSINSSLNMLSMAGLPPLLGFFMKWSALTLIINYQAMMSIPLVMSSLISLLFYLMLALSNMLQTSMTQSTNSPPFLVLFPLNLLSIPMFIIT